MAKRYRSVTPRSQKKSKRRLVEEQTSLILEEEDKFSDLSDHFFYRILSLLQLDDIARLSSLSKKFRKRCFMDRSLEIDLNIHDKDEEIQAEDEKSPPRQISSSDEDSFDDDEMSPRKRINHSNKEGRMSYLRINHMHKEEERRSYLINVLDKVMTLRHKDMKSLKIPCFRFKADEGVHVNGWIQNAARCNVKKLEIDLTIENGHCLELPCCESLKVFELNLYNGTLKLPSEGYSSLGLLNLNCVEIVCEDFRELISSCKCLKILILDNFLGVEKIEIDSSSLREISIVKTNRDDLKHIQVSANRLNEICVAWYFQSSEDKSFHLYAPILRSLRWRGDSVSNCHLGNFTSLQYASINLRHPSMLIENKSSLEEASNQDSLAQLIKTVKGATILKLNCWHIEVLVAHNHQLTSMDNVEELVLNVSTVKKDRQVPAIVTFLNLFPNLHALKINCCRQPWGWGADDLGSARVLETSSGECLSHLRRVKIELTGGGDETELIEYLLKYAKKLKEMIILYSSLDMNRLTELANTVHNFKAASHSRASLLLTPFM